MAKIRYTLIVILSFVLVACVDLPDDFVAPRYNIDINIPIAKRHLTIDEILDNDTSYVKWYTEGSSKNLLYATDTINIAKTLIGSKLTNGEFTSYTSQKVGEIKLSKFDNVELDLVTEDILGVQEGSLVLSPRDVSVEKDFNSSSDFETLNFSTNTNNVVSIVLTNNLPIDLLVKSLTIKNISDNIIIADLSNQVQLAPGQNYSEEVSVVGLKMENELNLKSDLYTPGTNGETVEFEASDNLGIDIVFPDNLYANSVKAEVPAQDAIVHSSSIEIDDSTQITEAIIHQGSFDFVFDNKLPTTLNGEIRIPSLLNANGNEYVKSFSVNSGQKHTIEEYDLSQWIINGSDGKINYEIEFVNEPSSGIIELDMNDSLRVDYNFGEIVFESFTGKLKPTKFKLDEISSNIDLHDLNDKINYQNINFEELLLNLDLNTSADLNINIDGLIELGYESSGTFYSQSLSAEIPGMNIIDIADLFNKTSESLPDLVKISGNAVANPDYKNTVSIANSDTIGGKAYLEIPLNLSIQNLVFNDTIDVEMEDFDQEEAEKLEEFIITIEVNNNIAMGGSFVGTVYDDQFNKLLELPTSSYDSNPESFEIPIPELDSNNNIVSGGISTQTFKINTEDAIAFSKGTQMIFTMTMNTAGSDNLKPVKIKLTDYIDIKVVASGKLEVSE